MTDDELLTEIEAIRARNNTAHVALQRLALEVAPERARALLKTIVENDRRIGHLSQALAIGPEARHQLAHMGENSEPA